MSCMKTLAMVPSDRCEFNYRVRNLRWRLDRSDKNGRYTERTAATQWGINQNDLNSDSANERHVHIVLEVSKIH